MLKKCILPVLFTFFICSEVLAATYYVNASTGNDGRTADQAQNSSTPWRTVQMCANNAIAGDTCLVAAETYNEIVHTTTNGSSGNLITFQATGTVYLREFHFNNNYNKLDGFIFNSNYTTPPGDYPGSYVRINEGASNNIISNNTNVHAASSSPTFAAGNGNNNIFTHNSISGGDRMGMDVNGNYNIYSYNTIYDLGTDSIRINNATYNQVLYNHVYNMRETGQHTDFIQAWEGAGISANHLIEGNYVHDSELQVVMLEASTPAFSNWTWRNNIFVNITGSAQTGANGSKWFNNTFWYVGQNTAAALHFDANWTVNNEVKNNIFIGCGGTFDPMNGTRGYDRPVSETGGAYNYYAELPTASTPWGATKYAEAEPNWINGGNPLFVGYANANYHLRATSPARDKGKAISGWSNPVDKDGVSRPQGSAWDIGAYEFQAESVGKEPNPPTNLRVLK